MGILRRVSPKHAAAAEQESREWFVICGECGTERTWRQLGGIRYKASSKGKKMMLKCPTCDARRWHSVERRRPDEQTEPGDDRWRGAFD